MTDQPELPMTDDTPDPDLQTLVEDLADAVPDRNISIPDPSPGRLTRNTPFSTRRRWIMHNGHADPEPHGPITCALGSDMKTPAVVTITVQARRGIVDITVTKSENADTVIPPFTPGTTDPVQVTSTRIDPSQPSSALIRATDGEGNVHECGGGKGVV